MQKTKRRWLARLYTLACVVPSNEEQEHILDNSGMLQYQTIPVTPFQQNCSLVWDDQTHQAAVIDPGAISI